ncbi:hypothetical protein F4824DRAFT_498096 [Ustulina deusta]|nr:hypothetical protein F4824DRAFT_498096 [Ustulina deusta]
MGFFKSEGLNDQTVQETDQGPGPFINLGSDYVDVYLVVPTDSSPGSLSANPLAGNDVTSFSLPTTWPGDITNTAYYGFPRSAWKIELVNCGCQVPHIQIRVPSDPERNCPGHVNHTLAFFNFPDLYANTLRLERLCIVEAMRRNCMAIGITAEMWCSAESVSPFFRRITHDTSTNDNLVRSVQGIFQTSQTCARAAGKSLVRANLIGSIGSIDEDEFFHDSLNGLICWGGVGVGRQDRNGVGTGTPWDIRSWEAKEWFIQKWWFVVGGEEGELVQQSKWWRALRGGGEESFMVR